MPRKRQAQQRRSVYSTSAIGKIFSERGLDYQGYESGSVSIDKAALKGVFLDFCKSCFEIPEDQFVQGLGTGVSPDFIPLFNEQLAVLIENTPSADLQETYHRTGHELLLSDSGKRSYVLITNFVTWEVFNLTGREDKYSVEFSGKSFSKLDSLKKAKQIKSFTADFISKSRRIKHGGTPREALKILRYGKFPVLNNNPLKDDENCQEAFSLGPNDVLVILKNEEKFRKKEKQYRDSLRESLGEGIYISFAIITDNAWVLSSPYLEQEAKGNYKNLLTLKDAFASVINAVLECRREVIRKRLGELVDVWNRDPKSYYEDDEAQTRKNFLDDILKTLGYRFKADGEGREEVYLESTGTADGRPDYAIKVDGRVLFFFEAKKPKVECSEWSNCSQAIRYSWSRGNVPVSILSNFREFKVLLAKTNPTEDNYSQLIIPELNFYSENKAGQLDRKAFQDLADNLVYISREAVGAGRFDEWLQEIGASIQEAVPVTTRFLHTVNDFRLRLADGLPKSVRNEELINGAVNQFLNRILFVRVAEDRRVLEDRSLWMRLKMWESRGKKRIRLHQELVQFFREIENHFNAGLFEANDTYEAIPFSDESLTHVVENLYQPSTEYHFAVLRPEIIGVAYEQALAQKISFTPSGRPKLIEKDELQSENGIYYTPEFVVDYIVRHTIRPVLEAKGLYDDLRIADIACGSGAFLVAAYRELLRFEKETLEKNIKKAVADKNLAELRRGGQEFYSVSIPRRRKILESHIFGLDVDKEACEKAKLGLFLVMMEDVLDFEKRKRALPSLEGNILNGNAIYETDYAGDSKSLYCKDPLNLFDKNDGFGSLNPSAEKNGVFDIIVGNPPYINIEKLKGKTEEKKVKDKGRKKDRKAKEEEKENPVSYLQRKYPLSSEGRTDLYCVFIERGLQLLKNGGLLSFITPDKWYYEPYGKLLREEIIEGNTLEKIVIAGEKIFKSAFRKCPAVPAAITIVRKGGHSEDHQTICEDYRTGYRLQFKDGEEETDYFNRFSLAPITKTGLSDKISENFSHSFRVFTEVERQIINKMDSGSINLGSIVYVNWGLRPQATKLVDASGPKASNKFGMIKGEDLSFGYYTGPSKAIIYKQANIHPGRMGFPPLMESKRILIAKVTGEEGISAVVDSGKNYNDDSVSMSLLYSEIPYDEERIPSELKEVSDLTKKAAEKYNYNFLHGVLCSRATSYYHAKWLTNELNVYPEHVRGLRIPNIEKAKNSARIEDLSKALQSFNSIKSGNVQAAQTCKKIVRALDRLVYDAFDLSKEMIEEIEGAYPSDLALPSTESAVTYAKEVAA